MSGRGAHPGGGPRGGAGEGSVPAHRECPPGAQGARTPRERGACPRKGRQPRRSGCAVRPRRTTEPGAGGRGGGPAGRRGPAKGVGGGPPPAALEWRDLREWTPGGRSHCAPSPSACCAADCISGTGDPRRCGGVDEAGGGAQRFFWGGKRRGGGGGERRGGGGRAR